MSRFEDTQDHAKPDSSSTQQLFQSIQQLFHMRYDVSGPPVCTRC